MDKRWHHRVACGLELTGIEALALVRTVCLPIVLSAHVLTAIANYVAPRMGRSDLRFFREGQESLALVLVGLLTVVGFLFYARQNYSSSTSRLTSSTWVVVAEMGGLWLALAAGVTAWSIISLYRISGPTVLAAAASTLVSLSPLTALAPGLARLRVGGVALVCLTVLGCAGMVGFFGPTFPMRADTVFELRSASQGWPADGLAWAACLLVSVGITHWRKPDPSCG